MLLDKLLRKAYQKLLIRYRGIPLVVIVYKPWFKGKNVTVHVVSPIGMDEYLMIRYDEIAEHIRKTYQSELDKVMRNDGGIL